MALDGEEPSNLKFERDLQAVEAYNTHHTSDSRESVYTKREDYYISSYRPGWYAGSHPAIIVRSNEDRFDPSPFYQHLSRGPRVSGSKGRSVFYC